jgi:hypothetical protein
MTTRKTKAELEKEREEVYEPVLVVEVEPQPVEPPAELPTEPVTELPAEPPAPLPEVTGIFLGEEDRRLLKKFNKHIVNKLGLTTTRSFRV